MLTHDDLADVKAIWEERVDPETYAFEVQIVGEHSAEMDQDRPLGAIVKASLSLRLIIWSADGIIFDESCPYDREALLASVRALAAHLADR